MEKLILLKFSRTYDLEYLALRFWIGMWVGVILLICVVTDASALVCVITRFTEENFAFLIAIIFIKEAFSKVCNQLTLFNHFSFNSS